MNSDKHKLIARSPGLSTLDSRRRWPILLLTLPFAVSVLGAWAWFNTDLGRSDSQLSTQGSQPRLWLTARTNIEGYVFVPEPVSESVKKTLGTTNILSGSFYKISDNSSQQPDPPFALGALPPAKASSTLNSQPRRKPSTLDSGLSTDQRASRVTVFLASWPAGSNKGLTAIQHTPDICWGGSGWKPISLGQPHQITIDIPASGLRSAVSDAKRPTLDPGLSTLNDQRPTAHPYSLPFDLRIFEPLDGPNHEAVVWCALSGGQSLIGGSEWGGRIHFKKPHGLLFLEPGRSIPSVLHAAQNRLPSAGKNNLRVFIAVEL